MLKLYKTRFAWNFNILPGEYQDKTVQSSSRQSSLINLKSREVNQTFLNTVWINLCRKSLTCSEKKIISSTGNLDTWHDAVLVTALFVLYKNPVQDKSFKCNSVCLFKICDYPLKSDLFSYNCKWHNTTRCPCL